jgi:hypothetical protein
MQSANAQRSRPVSLEALQAASLLDREDRLLEERRFLGIAPYRRRVEIDAELLEIRDDLERLSSRLRTILGPPTL